MTVAQAIRSRRSIRRFKDETIPEADLREMLTLASLAPSAFNAQTWRFVVIQDPALKEELRAASFGQAQVTNAPAVIVVYSDMENTLQTVEDTAHPGMGEEGKAKQRSTFDRSFGSQTVPQRGQWGLAQANIAFGFLMLAARSLGYDSVPMLGFQAERVREILGLPEHVEFAGILPVGKADEEGFPHHRHDLERLVSWR